MYIRYCITTALLLLFFFGCPHLNAEPSSLLSSPAKPSLTVPALPAFFNKPEADPYLVADTRLDHKVTLDEIGISLSNLLRKVSVTELPLTCASDCADTKLQVRVKDRSLRSVMASLAQLTPGTWKREGKGYCLYADPKATEYENRWWQLYGLERERVLAALRAEILTEMQQKPIFPDASKPDPENTPFEMASAMAQNQEFWYLLPEPLQEQIAGQIVDTAYYRTGRIIVQYPIEGAVVVPFQSIPLQAQADIMANAQLLRRSGTRMVNPVAVSFNNVGFDVGERVVTADGQWHDAMFSLSIKNSMDIAPTLPVDHHRLPEMMKRLGDQVPTTWKPLAEYQERRVWPNDPFQVVVDPQTPTNQVPPRRPEVLNWLADKAGVEFVADYYSVAGEPLSEAAKNQKLTRPLKRELDYRAAQEDMSWKQRTDGLYLFRDNRWYRDDRLEVPNKTLQGLLTTLQTAETPSQPAPPAQTDPAAEPAIPNNPLGTQLDLADSIVAQLTPWQIANGLPNYTIEPIRDSSKAGSTPVKLHKQVVIMNGKRQTYFVSDSTATAHPFDKIADIILDDYHTYLFHSGLTSDQADALLADGLLVSALSSTQAQQAAYLLPDLQVRFGNQPQTLLGLRPEPGFDQVQLGPVGFPAAALPLHRIRLAVSAPAAGPNDTSASP